MEWKSDELGEKRKCSKSRRESRFRFGKRDGRLARRDAGCLNSSIPSNQTSVSPATFDQGTEIEFFGNEGANGEAKSGAGSENGQAELSRESPQVVEKSSPLKGRKSKRRKRKSDAKFQTDKSYQTERKVFVEGEKRCREGGSNGADESAVERSSQSEERMRVGPQNDLQVSKGTNALSRLGMEDRVLNFDRCHPEAPMIRFCIDSKGRVVKEGESIDDEGVKDENNGGVIVAEVKEEEWMPPYASADELPKEDDELPVDKEDGEESGDESLYTEFFSGLGMRWRTPLFV